MGVVAGQQLLNPARDKARHRGDIRDGVTPREQPDHLNVPRRGRILGRPEPRFQILDAQMISNPRHGLPPRLTAHQPTRFATAQESKPSPSSGIRMTPDLAEEFRKGTSGRPKLVVSAHLDTVFPEGTDVSVKERDGTTLAPGIGDDARGLAALLSLLQALRYAFVVKGPVWDS